jgi:hypothetical protein
MGIARQQKSGPGESMWMGAVALRSINSPRRGGKVGTWARVVKRGGMQQMMPCGYDNPMVASTVPVRPVRADHAGDRFRDRDKAIMTRLSTTAAQLSADVSAPAPEIRPLRQKPARRRELPSKIVGVPAACVSFEPFVDGRGGRRQRALSAEERVIFQML